MADVFISYKRVDRRRIEQMSQALIDLGLTVWFDYSIEVGEDWARNMTPEDVINNVILAAQPTKEFVKVTDIAQLAVFLTTEAANQINGTSLSIDGGWVAQ